MNPMKPILFNTDMVRANLEDRKTNTRRLIKPQPEADDDLIFILAGGHKDDIGKWQSKKTGRKWTPPCHAGDILYVRETWQFAYDADGNDQIIEETGRYLYYADNPAPYNDWIMPDGTHRDLMPWHPSIHMLKEAARLFLRVTRVRVERLQDITDADAIKEGVPDEWPMDPVYCPKCKGDGLLGAVHHATLGFTEIDCPFCEKAVTRFANLWNSTIKKKDLDTYGWDANPWVWVIEYERISKEEAMKC